MEKRPAISVNLAPFSTVLLPILSYAKSGIPAPTTTPARVLPIVRKVERDCLSLGSDEIVDAIEPYGMLIEV